MSVIGSITWRDLRVHVCVRARTRTGAEGAHILEAIKIQ